MGHHYQNDEVMRHADLRGDSLELARQIASVESQYIIFCGVNFMAESAALLARPGQEVHLPEPSAECSMAMMSPPKLVEAMLDNLSCNGQKVIPLVYINSTLAVKAAVGRYHGATCTSANAEKMLTWALEEGDAVLFLPDKNLGANVANRLNVTEDERFLLDIRRSSYPISKARLYLWPGFCSIHTRFKSEQIELIRTKHPGVKVVVHPECTPELVSTADAIGSTSFIIQYVENMPTGTSVAIGTEINLVERLAAQHRGRVTVLSLAESACIHMAKTTEERLAASIDALIRRDQTGEPSPFRVNIADAWREPAKAAIDKMFEVV